MPTALDLTGQSRRRDEPPTYVLRRGLLFRCGSYQDKQFSMTTAELLRAVSLFRPVPIKVEHLDIAIFGDKLGRCRRVWTDPAGVELFGEVSLLDDLSKILPDPLPVSACFDRRTKLITEVSLVLSPRIADAAVSAAFAKLRTTMPTELTPRPAAGGPATRHTDPAARMRDDTDQADDRVRHGAELLDQIAADVEAALKDAEDPMYSDSYRESLQNILDAVNDASAKLVNDDDQDDDQDQDTERTTVDPTNSNGGGGSEFGRGRAKFGGGMSAARRAELLGKSTLGQSVLRREQR